LVSFNAKSWRAYIALWDGSDLKDMRVYIPNITMKSLETLHFCIILIEMTLLMITFVTPFMRLNATHMIAHFPTYYHRDYLSKCQNTTSSSTF
ncbi:hypothetical protein ACJX0J_026050, partial [Zea mays]